MMHRHSCKACCMSGPTIYVAAAAGEPSDEEEAPSSVAHKQPSARSLPLVAMAAAGKRRHHHQHLIQPCGCLHSTLYTHPHHLNMQTCFNSLSCAASPYTGRGFSYQVQTPEPLLIEAPAPAGARSTHVHTHPHMVQYPHAYAHHHIQPSDAIKSLDLVHKYGSDLCSSLPLVCPNTMDSEALHMRRSIAPMCDHDKLRAAVTANKVLGEAPCCATHMALESIAPLNNIMGSCHLQTQASDKCQVHSHCVAPVPSPSTLQLRAPPPMQEAPKSNIAPTAKVSGDQYKETTPLADYGGQKDDDDWTGNGRTGVCGRGRGRGRGGWGGGWLPNKRKREVDGCNWSEGSKPNACSERGGNLESPGWGDRNVNGNGLRNRTNNGSSW